MKIENKNHISFLVIIIFLTLGVFLVNQSSRKSIHIAQPFNIENIQYVKIAGNVLKVDLALTDEKRTQGLSGRPSLKEDEGMLFVFEDPGYFSFWMKDMNFPIDIIWLGEDLKVIHIKKDARPEAYPEIYGPDTSLPDAKYVLEVVSGFSNKNDLKVGDAVELLY